ncbi:MAG: GAK system CofD-like protein [Deltaproteobacteria bacterium]|jgi:CofD-related protein of GAK system|nr:GAK system CofD-like protein [Deltaproteobacteria bacterium]
MNPPEAQGRFSAPPLFFGGGTALKAMSGVLIRHTAGSVHVLTPFDSGGSSAVLRRTFDMPAVGDLRARILSLADENKPGVKDLRAFFSHRLPRQGDEQWAGLIQGRHPLLHPLDKEKRELICGRLAWLAGRLPAGFALAGASLGNLFLAAEYLKAGRRLAPAIAALSRLVRARGKVFAVVQTPAHLAVRLLSGDLLLGQHTFSGKFGPAPPAPISRIWLTKSETSREPARIAVSYAMARRIRRAGCVCYPMGSFYSSILASLLPAGVGQAVAANAGPKIFIPNLGFDPELAGHTLQMQVERLLDVLLADAPGARPRDVLSHVLADARAGVYPGGIPQAWLAARGIILRDARLVDPDSAPLAGAEKLVSALADLLRDAR